VLFLLLTFASCSLCWLMRRVYILIIHKSLIRKNVDCSGQLDTRILVKCLATSQISVKQQEGVMTKLQKEISMVSELFEQRHSEFKIFFLLVSPIVTIVRPILLFTFTPNIPNQAISEKYILAFSKRHILKYSYDFSQTC